MDKTKVKAKDSGDDTVSGHLPQAWRKPRGVPIPETQFSFGDEDDGGGDVEGLPFFLSLHLRVEFFSFNSPTSCASSSTLLHKSCLIPAKDGTV